MMTGARRTRGGLAATSASPPASSLPPPPAPATTRRTTTTTAALPALNFFFGNDNGGKSGNSGGGDDDKHVVFLRHGTTEMNVYMRTQCSYYSSEWEDPMTFFDTRLTADGAQGARRVAKQAAALSPRPELIVASPLTRALQTAELAFGPLLDAGVPCLALPLARERLFLSSDVGRDPRELAREFPRWSASLLEMRGGWWLESGEEGAEEEDEAEDEEAEEGEAGRAEVARDAAGAAAATARAAAPPPSARRRRSLRTPTPKPHPTLEEEGDAAFAARVDALGAWLRARPERCVAVVSHWGPILEATGAEFENVEMRSFRMSQLRL